MGSLAAGADVDYYLDSVGAGYYLNAEGEPPGEWAGRGAASLGLAGQVDADTMRALYHDNLRPDGTPLLTGRRGPKFARNLADRAEERVQEIVAGRRFITPAEVRQVRRVEHAKTRKNVPYYDYTHNSEKSATVAWAAFASAARAARQAGDEQAASGLEATARGIEDAVRAGGAMALATIQDEAAYVRRGAHSKHTGQWHDAAGVVAVTFLQHDNREGEPHLHVHIPILNAAARLDGADENWSALDGGPLYAGRRGFNARATMAQAQALARLGFGLIKGENGYEVAGVPQAMTDAFSRRAARVKADADGRIADFVDQYGRMPHNDELKRIKQAATLATRPAKHKPAGDADAILDRWAETADEAEAGALATLYESIWEAADEHRPLDMPSSDERARMMRAAVAEVQANHASWTRTDLESELMHQAPVLPADADWVAYLIGMADDILAGLAEGVTVLPVAPSPDVVSGVGDLGTRKDGVSILRRPGEGRWVTQEHLDMEKWLVREARRPILRRVTDEQAADAVAGTTLDAWQVEAVTGMLTAGTLVTLLEAGPGMGKSHAVAALSFAWTRLTGCRVIGLSTSENAARVLADEKVTEVYNIAKFLGRRKDEEPQGFCEHDVPGSCGICGEHRGNRVPLFAGDILVIDEASQVDTRDWAELVKYAARSGARVIGSGDTQQLPAVGAGGIFRLLAAEYGTWKLHEPRRFNAAWEREASIRLRDGDPAVMGVYDEHGRVKHGPENYVHMKALDAWQVATRQGDDVVLLAASNAEAAVLSRLAQERLAEDGKLKGRREVQLRDGNRAGYGDLVRARLNTRIDADGQTLANRDTIRIESFQGSGRARAAVVVRRVSLAEWSKPFLVPVAYLEENAELAYAGNIHVSQGRTVHQALTVVRQGMQRGQMLVGMTRGRADNTIFVVTGPADPGIPSRADRDAARAVMVERIRQAPAAEQARLVHEAAAAEAATMVPRLEQLPWEAVVAGVMANSDVSEAALTEMKEAADFPVHSAHLLEIGELAWWKYHAPEIDQMIRDRIPAAAYERYVTDPQREALLNDLRTREMRGQPIAENLDRITRQGYEGLRSIAAGLHGRLGKVEAPARDPMTIPWSERTPDGARPVEVERNEMMDARMAGLGVQAAERPEPWALEAWGVPPAEPGPSRDDWQHRAGIVANYREMAGITRPGQALGPPPVARPELAEAFHASVTALALADEQALLKAMGRGELDARVTGYERVQAAAPPDLRPQLDDNAQAIAFAAERAVSEAVPVLQAQRDEMAVRQAVREEWEEAMAPQRIAAEEAHAELRVRGLEAPAPEAGTPDEPLTAEQREDVTAWWGQYTAELHREMAAETADLALKYPATDAEFELAAARQLADIDAGNERIRSAVDELNEGREAARTELRDEPVQRLDLERELAPAWEPGSSDAGARDDMAIEAESV